MINLQWFELPMSRTNFHGSKDVRAIEVRLYKDPFGVNGLKISHMMTAKATSCEEDRAGDG